MADEQADLLTAFDDRIETLPESVDRAAVERMRVVAHVLDDSIRIPATDVRIGVDPLLSTLPVAGDLISGAFSLYIVIEATRLGVSFTTVVKLLTNVTVDVVGGSIPIVGDVFDALWKANKRNFLLVLEDLTKEAEQPTADRGEPIEITVE